MTTSQETTKSAGQILATKELFAGRPTTPRPPHVLTESARLKKRPWLDKWLRLRITHPQLSKVENEIYDICTEYAKTPARGRTIVIFGENGCGKSHIAKRVCYWARMIAPKIPLVDQGESMGFSTSMLVNWPRVVDGFKEARWGVISDLEESTLMALDDVGAEHDPSMIGVEKLYVMLNIREFKWNIITTNIVPGQWEKKFDRRLSSRLFRNAQHLDLSQVPDYSTT